jgi:nitrate/TMAO reductase-like tetraheme cytochrome c subunit
MSPETTGPSRARRWARMLTRNPISLAGVALAIVSLANIFFFSLIDLISAKPSPYVGILAYIAAPGFLICGLLLMGLGLLRERKKKISGEAEAARYPRIDLNDPNQRSAVAFFGSFLLAFVLLSSVGSYKAYEFTDSVKFCGQVCHTVMNPEYTTYRISPHARVACVDCHVGSGAAWYLKSKVTGTHQLFDVVLHDYPRPIPTPVLNLRPAQQTCEQCHWPQKFYGSQLKIFTHYASDEKNTPLQIRMLIKTGGGDPVTGEPEGIHWHMNTGNVITYVAADEKREVIPYIHVKDLQGRVTEYYAKDSKLSNEQIAQAPKRRMDCVDCHNRPTHIYVPPDQSVDQSLLAHRLDVSLPYIKQQAVAALTASYNTTDAAMQGIAKSLNGFYLSKYPDIAKSRRGDVRSAVEEVQQIFRRTEFPEMKVNWQTHPDNLGHFYFNGCFRCHDGQHVSAEGKVIPKDCDTCHTVMSQSAGMVSEAAAPKVNFQHPLDLGDLTQVNCSDCHNGGAGP